MLELIFFFITTADEVSGRQKTAESKLSDVNLMRHSVFDDKRLQRLSSVGECARALSLRNSISQCCTYTHTHIQGHYNTHMVHIFPQNMALCDSHADISFFDQTLSNKFNVSDFYIY